LEDRESTDDEMSRRMWKKVEDRKTNKAKIEEVRRKGEEEGNEKTDNR